MGRRGNVSIPGARSKELARRLRAHEERNVTFLADDFPVFWESARGATVTDADDNAYLDCTAAFGVANVGHCNVRVVEAIAEQAAQLIHGMGDVHPSAIRVRLIERLLQILPGELDRVFLATTGSEAIEAALKTAMLATGKSRFAAFRGGYHGLSFGALAVGGIERFRKPFEGAMRARPLLLDFPRDGECTARQAEERALGALESHDDVAAIVTEPVQGRAGVVVPPPGYLAALRRICDQRGIVLIVDEIFTGFGRTGRWFAIERDSVVPDLLCIGKAMGSGVPISAAIGRAAIMDAWPLSTGEALHTSTYLGNPLACASALATIDELQRRALPKEAARLGAVVGPRLNELRAHPSVVDVRGCGLLWAVQVNNAATASTVVRRALRNGVIFLQSGTSGDVVAILPPLVIAESQLAHAIDVLEAAIGEAG
ncbi:MAG: aspartate aminotransferase family protein [Candidatus Eremiobacteraeota bacterium]|nr:aspartate aminotransferase family protein [Candidatus Eremiobacteraeota bacterium]